MPRFNGLEDDEALRKEERRRERERLKDRIREVELELARLKREMERHKGEPHGREGE